MIIPELISYIKSQLAAGVSRESISSVLSSQGWTPQDIQAGFAAISEPVISSPISQPVTSSSRKKWGIILSLVILVIIFVTAGLYFFLNKFSNTSAPIKDIESSTEISDDLPPLNDKTREYFTDDINNQLNSLGIKQTAFNLDAESKKILSNVIVSLNASSSVIFNQLGYNGLETVRKNDTFYFKPQGSSISESEYLKVITKEIVKPEEFLDNKSPFDRDVYKLFYDDYVAKKAGVNTEASLKTYLDKQVASNTITKYDYDNIDGSLIVYYPNKEIGVKSNPSLFIRAMDKVISSHANPEKYMADLVSSSEQEFSSNNVLIINTQGGATSTRIINREILQNNLSIILDDTLSQEEKLKALSGSVRIELEEDKTISSKPSFLSNLFSTNKAQAQSANAVSNLLSRAGTIVPPDKTIYVFQGVDSLGVKLAINYVIEQFKSSGAFSTFIKNGYYYNLVQRSEIGQPTIEKFANLFLNDKATSIVYVGHGGEAGELYMELYKLGEGTIVGATTTTSDPDYKQKESAFTERLKNLRTNYGTKSINGDEWSTALTEEEINNSGLVVWGFGTDLLRERLNTNVILGVIYITPTFFEQFKNQPKKSLVILDACYAGTLASSVNSVVTLTSPANSETTISMFFSDLAKLDPYLSKLQNPGGVSFDLTNFRTYDLLNSFSKSYVIFNASSTKEVIDNRIASMRACNNTKDTLCTVVLSGSAGQTLAISPNVKSATGEKIEFNAPMETEKVWADKIVTVDASKCSGVSEENLNLKPEWDVSGGGDKVIKLPWKDKVYREWEDKDFSDSGSPKVNMAVITVKNDKAVSAISNVQLTGNPDCCTKDGCGPTQCYKDPTALKYNGNQAKTDFVMMKPCVTPDVYYKACTQGNQSVSPEFLKLPGEEIEDPNKILEQIEYSSNCYNLGTLSDENKAKAAEIKMEDIKEGSDCKSRCTVGAPIASDACMGEILYPSTLPNPSQGKFIFYPPVAAFGKHTAYIKAVESSDYPSPDKKQLIYDGKVIVEYDDINTNTSVFDGLQLFGEKIFYQKLAPTEVSSCIMSTNSILCLDRNKNLYLDSKIIGTTNSGNIGTRDPMGYYKYVGPKVLLFDKNVAWIDENKNAKLRLSDGTIKTFPDAKEINLFGEHLVFEREGVTKIYDPELDEYDEDYGSQIIYDGKVLGPGYQAALFGDSLAYVNGNSIIINGKSFNVPDILGLKTNLFFDLKHLSIFGKNVVFQLKINNIPHIIYNWKNIGQGEEPVIFGDNLAFIRDGHVIYNGKDLGPATPRPGILLYGNHIGFLKQPPSTGDRVSESFYYDGESYYENWSPRPSLSLPNNLMNCYQYYMENNVPTSPYGTVKY